MEASRAEEKLAMQKLMEAGAEEESEDETEMTEEEIAAKRERQYIRRKMKHALPSRSKAGEDVNAGKDRLRVNEVTWHVCAPRSL
jgi:hypothetical protein